MSEAKTTMRTFDLIKSPKIRWILTGTLLFIAAVMMFHLYHTTEEQNQHILRPWLLPVSVVIMIIQQLLSPISSMLALRGLNIRAPYVPMLWINMFAVSANSFVPFPAAYPIRVVMQKKMINLPYSSSVTALAMETFLGYGLTIATGLVASYIWLMPAFENKLHLQGYKAAISLFVIGLLLICIFLVSAIKGPFSERKSKILLHIRRALEQISKANWGFCLYYILVFLFLYLLAMVRFELILLSVGYSISPGPLLAVIICSYLVGIISAVPMGLGVRDVSLVSLLVFLGVPLAPATAAALIERFLITLNYLLNGLISVNILGREIIDSIRREQSVNALQTYQNRTNGLK